MNTSIIGSRKPSLVGGIVKYMSNHRHTEEEIFAVIQQRSAHHWEDDLRLHALVRSFDIEDPKAAYIRREIPRYTADERAALTLCPLDHDWIMASVNDGLTPYACCGSLKEYYGFSPAASFVLAALQARIRLRPRLRQEKQ